MAPQLHRNCTSERPTCSFPAPLPQTNTYCQLVEGAPPRAAKDCAFLRFTTSASPFTRSSKRPLLYVAFIHEIGCQKSRGRRFVPSDTSDELLGSFRYPFASIAQPEGFSSKQQGFHLKRPTCIFSSPSTWRHAISPNFFYKPNTARKPKTSTDKPAYRNDKNSFLPFTKAIILPGIRHSPTPVGRFPLTTDTDFQRNKNFARYREHGLPFLLTLQAKAVTRMHSLCEKTDYPRVLFLISSLLFAKRSPFSGKSRLVFPASSRASFFSSRSAERDGALPHSFAQFSTAGIRSSPFCPPPIGESS